MARSRSRSTRSQASSRSTSSRRAAAAPPPEETGDEGMGIDAGIAIITTIVLVVAILFLDYELGTSYGEGLFYK